MFEMNKFRREKDELRQTNGELMERLRQIWNSYKQVLPSKYISSEDSDEQYLTTSIVEQQQVIEIYKCY